MRRNALIMFLNLARTHWISFLLFQWLVSATQKLHLCTVASGLFPSLFSAFLDSRLGSLGLEPLLLTQRGSQRARVSPFSSQTVPTPPSQSQSLWASLLPSRPSPSGQDPWHEPKPAGAQREPLGTGSLSPPGRLSPKAPALHLLSKFDRVTGEPRPKLGVQVGGRGNLDHFLVPPLDGTVSLVQVQNVPVLVS